MAGAPVFGSRTWMWAIAAPALAASIAAAAICSGVIGSPGCCSGLVMLPVTAQVMMVFSAMSPTSCSTSPWWFEPNEGVPSLVSHEPLSL